MVRQQRTHREFVMKAFASHETFASEARLYSDSSCPLGAFLPQAKAIVDNAEGEFRDPHGHQMPPCIIMEKGESLDMWCRRAEPDRPLVYAVRFRYHRCNTSPCKLRCMPKAAVGPSTAVTVDVVGFSYDLKGAMHVGTMYVKTVT